MKIVKFTAENVKKLRVVQITPTGAMIQITGANGSGKSSVLDSIYWALSGTKAIESKPVRDGEEKAVIRLDLGEIIVTRRFTAAGGTSLIVEAADGSKFSSPQKMLDDLLGTLTFDPLAFSRMSAQAQMEQLRSMVEIEIDIDELDAEVKKLYDTRTDLGRQVKVIDAKLVTMAPPPELEYLEMVDETALVQQLVGAGETNTAIKMEKIRRESKRMEVEKAKKEIDLLREQAAKLMKQAGELNEFVIKSSEEFLIEEPLQELISTDDLQQQITSAKASNALYIQEQARVELFNQQKLLSTEMQSLTFAIEERNQKRRSAIASAKMPLPELSFSDADPLAGQKLEVLYGGIPLAQASSSEQLRVSVAIAMAANPQLRVIRIKDGSLLDDNSLKLVADMAKDSDYQIWLERVDTSGKVGVVMEDGSVKSVNEEPELKMDDL